MPVKYEPTYGETALPPGAPGTSPLTITPTPPGPEPEVWKPDYSKDDPYADMPPGYEEKVKAAFIPTKEQPLSPIERARERGEVVGGVVSLPPEPEPEPEPEPPTEPVTIPEVEPEPPTPPGYETVVEAGTTYLVKDGQYYRQFDSGAPVRVMEPERLRTERLYGVTGTEKDITPESVTTEGMAPHEIVIAMRDAGADVATLTKYLNEHPEAQRGAEVGQLIQGLGAQFTGFSELTGETRIEKAGDLGLLPEGFDELPQELKDAYGISNEAYNTAVGIYNEELRVRQVKVDTIIKTLGPVTDAQGNIDFQKAFATGLGGAIYEGKALGMWSEMISTPEGDISLEEYIVKAQFGAIEAGIALREFEESLKEMPIEYQEAYEAEGMAGIEALDLRKLTDFEERLKTMAPEFQEAYAIGGMEGYNKAVEKYVADFEADLVNQPKAFGDAYREGGFDAYNALVARQTEMASDARARYALDYETDPKTGELILDSEGQPIRKTYWISEELAQEVESSEFEEEWQTLAQPASISDEDYAQIKQFILPSGLDSAGAFAAGASSDVINQYVLATSSQEFRDRVASGELILLPYGQPITKEVMDKLPTPTQDILKESGIVGLEAYQEQVKADNEAESNLKNTGDALWLSITGLGHDVYSFGLANLQGLFPDVKEGDMKAVYKYNADMAYGASVASIFMKEPIGMFYTAEEAVVENEKNAVIRAALVDMYEEAQSVRADWVASHPELQPVYPEGPVQSAKANPLVLLDPLFYTEIIANTLPYTLSTMGVMLVGGIVGGPVGFVAGSTAAFGITMAVEGHGIYEDALAEGATPERARELMNTYGAMSAAVETVGDALFVGTLGSLTSVIMPALGRNVAGGLIRGAAAKYGWALLTTDMVINFVNQGSQEYIQEIIHNAAIKTVNENRPLLEGAADAFVAGVIGTGPFVLIPAGGTAIKLVTTPTAADLAAGALEISISDQSKVLDKVLAPVEDITSLTLIKDPEVQRRIASQYNITGAKVQEYASIMLQMKQTQKAISDLGLAKTPQEVDLLNRMEAKVSELKSKLDELGPSVKKAIKDYIDALAEATDVESTVELERLKEVSIKSLGEIDSITSQLFGIRTALVIEKDIRNIEDQITELKEDQKKATTSAQVSALGKTISILGSQLSDLREEIKKRSFDTGERVITTESGDLALVVKSDQQVLVEAKEELLEVAEVVAREKAAAGITEEVIVSPLILESVVFAKSLSARADASNLDTSFAIGEAVRAAKEMPTEVRLSLYDAAGRLDNAISSAASTYRIGQLYLTQTLPAEVRVTLTRATLDLETAVDNAKMALIKIQQAEIDVDAFITGKVVDTLNRAVKSVHRAIVALKAAIARARVFATKDFPEAAMNTVMDAAGGVDTAISRAEEMSTRATYYLAQTLPAEVQVTLTKAKLDLEATVAKGYQSLIAIPGRTADVATNALRDAAKGVEEATAKVKQALVSAKMFVVETIPEVTREAANRAITSLETSIARADTALRNYNEFMATIPEAARAALEGVTDDVTAIISETRRAVIQAKQFVVEGVSNKAAEILKSAAVSLEAAMAKADTALRSYGEFVVEEIPEAARATLRSATEALSTAVAEVGKAASETKQALESARTYITGITETVLDTTVDTAMNAAEALDSAISRAASELRVQQLYLTQELPADVRVTVTKITLDLEAAITKAKGAVTQAKQLIAQKTSETLDKAAEMLMSAAGDLDATVTKVASSLRVHQLYLTQMFPAEVSVTLTKAILDLETAVAQAKKVATIVKGSIIPGITKGTESALRLVDKKITSAITLANQALEEAGRLVTRGLPDAARRTLVEAAKAIESILGSVRTLVAKATSGIISLPGETIDALEEAEALLYNLSVQVVHKVGEAEGRIEETLGNIKASVRGALYGIRDMRESFTGTITEGFKAGLAGKEKPVHWVRELQKREGIEEVLWSDILERRRTPSMAELKPLLDQVRRLTKDYSRGIREFTRPQWGRDDFGLFVGLEVDILEEQYQEGEISEGILADILEFLGTREDIEDIKRDPGITPERQAEIDRKQEIVEKLGEKPKDWEMTPEVREKIAKEAEDARAAADARRQAEAEKAATLVAEPEVEVEEEISPEEVAAEREAELTRRVEKAREAVSSEAAAIITESAIGRGIHAYNEAVAQGKTTAQAVQAAEQAVQSAIQIEEGIVIQEVTEAAYLEAIQAAIQAATQVAIEEAVGIEVAEQVAVQEAIEVAPEVVVKEAIQEEVEIALQEAAQLILPPFWIPIPKGKEVGTVDLTTTPKPPEAGVTNPKSRPEIPIGVMVSIRADASEGWEFDHWQGDISPELSRKNPTTVTMDKDRHIVGIFKSKVPGVPAEPKIFGVSPTLEIGIPKLIYEEVVTERDITKLKVYPSRRRRNGKRRTKSPGTISITEVKV